MKRLNDLLSGKEKIKVDGIESAGDVKIGSDVLINVDGGSNARFMGTTEGAYLVDGYDNELGVNELGLTFTWAGTTDIFSCNNVFFVILKPLRLPNYTTASRPTVDDEGMIIYDSTLKKCILYNGTAWVNLDGTALS